MEEAVSEVRRQHFEKNFPERKGSTYRFPREAASGPVEKVR